jgi:hypothetical protein
MVKLKSFPRHIKSEIIAGGVAVALVFIWFAITHLINIADFCAVFSWHVIMDTAAIL